MAMSITLKTASRKEQDVLNENQNEAHTVKVYQTMSDGSYQVMTVIGYIQGVRKLTSRDSIPTELFLREHVEKIGSLHSKVDLQGPAMENDCGRLLLGNVTRAKAWLLQQRKTESETPSLLKAEASRFDQRIVEWEPIPFRFFNDGDIHKDE